MMEVSKGFGAFIRSSSHGNGSDSRAGALAARRLTASLAKFAPFMCIIAVALVCLAAVPPATDGHDSHVFALQDPEEIPTANAGPDQTVYEHEPVYFDGSASTDDVGIVNYTWTLRYGGLNWTYLTAEFNFTFGIPDIYNVTLNVTDADGHYDTDVVQITVLERPVDYLATYWWTIPVVGLVLFVILFFYFAVKGKIGFVSEPRRGKIRLEFMKLAKISRQLISNPMGLLGIVILAFFIVLAIFGPVLAPYPVIGSVPTDDEGNRIPPNSNPSYFSIPAPSYIVPLKLAFPLAFAAIIAFTMLFSQRTKGSLERYDIDGRVIAVSLAVSVALLAIVVVDSYSSFDIQSPEWFNSAAVLGLTLIAVSMALRDGTGLARAKVAIALPFALPVLAMLPKFMDVDTETEIILTGVFIILGGIAVVTSAGLVRSAKSRYVRMNPRMIGTPEGNRLKRSGKVVSVVGVVLAVLVIVTGFLSILQMNWTEHWMGTEFRGFDIYSQLLFGARTSIIVGVISALIASVVGAGVGLYSGYAGGWKDEVVMRANDVVLSIPWLVLMIIIAGLLRSIDLTGIILIIGLTGWSPTARMVRSQVLSLKERQYVERARAIGASDMNIIRRHILPNAFPLVFANTILIVAVSILSESTLSFLGLRPVGTVTWGTMLSYASELDAIRMGLHWWILAPGVCIVLVVLGFTLVGYALDDILNPKLRKR